MNYKTVKSILDVEPLVRDVDVILFDMDDTVYSEKDNVRCGFRTLTEYVGDPSLYDELWNAYIEKKSSIKEVLTQRKLYTEERYNEWLHVFRFAPSDITPYAGFCDMLDRFLADGKRLGMITDGRVQSQEKKLAGLGISHYFEKIIITDSLGGVEYRKPCTVAFEMMRDHFGTPYERMVYIGDNLAKDMQPPLALGMKFIHFDNEDGIYRRLR